MICQLAFLGHLARGGAHNAAVRPEAAASSRVVAGPTSPRIRRSCGAPTLLIVGGRDEQVLDLECISQEADAYRDGTVDRARGDHLFEEPGTLKWWQSSPSPGSPNPST